jgi:hypothetical protein
VAKRIIRIGGMLLLGVALLGIGWLGGRLGYGSVIDATSLPEAERQFAERMKNVSLVGTFTLAGREGQAPSPDRYDIFSVEKVGEDRWRFNASMDCCGLKGTKLPIVVPMRFVGDTPMIMMTDLNLPGVGTFTVRLLFHGDRYSGTWQHGQYGGAMSGRIEKIPAPAAQ